MRAFLVLLFIIVSSHVRAQEMVEVADSTALNKFIESVSGVDDFSFRYKSAAGEGVVSIGASGVYMSQNDKVEIFEREGVRYTYNSRRKRVDIEYIKPDDDSVRDIFLWIAENINYIMTQQGKESGKLTRFRFEHSATYKNLKGKEKSYVAEVIDVYFNDKGELVKVSYVSRESKRVTFDIMDFTIKGKKTSDYFTFNPEERDDIEVTDYRDNTK